MNETQINALTEQVQKLKADTADRVAKIEKQIEKQIEKLKAEPVDLVRWRPDRSGLYRFMNSVGDIDLDVFQDNMFTAHRITTGNCAPDTEAGREYLRQREEKAKYRQRYLEACDRGPNEDRWELMILGNGRVDAIECLEDYSDGMHGFSSHTKAMTFAASEDQDFLKKMLTEGML